MKISRVKGLWIVKIGMCEYVSRAALKDAFDLAFGKGWDDKIEFKRVKP